MQKESDALSSGDSTAQLLNERGKTHGDFIENGQIMQALKNVAQTGSRWKELEPYQKEAIHMILHKVGRIVCGKPNFKDHWDDIAGYAKLVADRCKTPPVSKQPVNDPDLHELADVWKPGK